MRTVETNCNLQITMMRPLQLSDDETQYFQSRSSCLGLQNLRMRFYFGLKLLLTSHCIVPLVGGVTSRLKPVSGWKTDESAIDNLTEIRRVGLSRLLITMLWGFTRTNSMWILVPRGKVSDPPSFNMENIFIFGVPLNCLTVYRSDIQFQGTWNPPCPAGCVSGYARSVLLLCLR